MVLQAVILFELLQEESSASLVEIQDEVIRQMGNVDKACRLLQLRHSSSPSTQHESSPPHDDGDTGFQWGKTDDGEDEGDFGSIQSEFTNLEIDPGTGMTSHSDPSFVRESRAYW